MCRRGLGLLRVKPHLLHPLSQNTESVNGGRLCTDVADVAVELEGASLSASPLLATLGAHVELDMGCVRLGRVAALRGRAHPRLRARWGSDP